MVGVLKLVTPSMSEKIEVAHDGITVRILRVQFGKKGILYPAFRLSDYSSGQRKLWTFADLGEAEAKAKEIAPSQAGKVRLLRPGRSSRISRTGPANAACARRMQASTLNKVGRVTAYAVGGALIFVGIMGLLIEFSKGKPSLTNFYGYVLAAVFVTSGALTCVAVRSHYGGGLWSFFGLVFVGAATGRFALVTELYMRSRHLISPAFFFSTTTALWGVGCYGLFWGHLRHHKERKICLHDAA